MNTLIIKDSDSFAGEEIGDNILNHRERYILQRGWRKLLLDDYSCPIIFKKENKLN